MIKHNFVLFIILLFSLYQSSFAQQRGFFFTERDPEHYSTNGKFSVETIDGCYIVSEVSIQTSLNESQVDILKFSAEGELLNRVAVGGRNLEIAGLFQIPDEERQYCLVLDNGENTVSHPRITRFDDDLNILSNIEVELPQNVPADFLIAARAWIGKDNKIYYSFTNIGEEIACVHLLFTLDGQLEKFTVEPRFRHPGSYFLLPDGSRWSYVDGVLSCFDDSLELNPVHMFQKIVDEPQADGISHQVWVKSALYPTATVLPDSSFLIAEEVQEIWRNQQGIVDSDFHQMAFFKSSFTGEVEKVITIGNRDTLERPAYYQAVDYMYPNAIYLCGFQHLEPDSFGTLVIPNQIFLKKVDGDLNVTWEKSYVLGAEHYMPKHLLATRDGGCLIAGRVMYDIYEEESDLFVLKINADGTVGTKEVIVEDVRPYTYYPNPAQDELHFQFSSDITPTQIELYDLQGRLVRSQRNGLESLNLKGLASGAYTMRVTLEGGKVFSEKVVKE